MRSTFGEAERELTAYFTSALGVAAQRYDSGISGGQFDSNEAVARLAFGPMVGALRAHRATEWTLEQIERPHYWTLRLRFFPQRIGAGPYQTAMGPLAALGLETEAVRKAFEKWRELSPKRQNTGLVEWLDDEATRGSGAARREAIETQATGRLDVALGVYDAARIRRLRLESEARKQREEAAAEEHARLRGDRIRAPAVRREVREVSDSIRAILAEHGDILALADTPEGDST